MGRGLASYELLHGSSVQTAEGTVSIRPTVQAQQKLKFNGGLQPFG